MKRQVLMTAAVLPDTASMLACGFWAFRELGWAPRRPTRHAGIAATLAPLTGTRGGHMSPGQGAGEVTNAPSDPSVTFSDFQRSRFGRSARSIAPKA